MHILLPEGSFELCELHSEKGKEDTEAIATCLSMHPYLIYPPGNPEPCPPCNLRRGSESLMNHQMFAMGLMLRVVTSLTSFPGGLCPLNLTQ